MIAALDRPTTANRRPALNVHLRFRGALAYIDGRLGDGPPFPLCRLRYPRLRRLLGFLLNVWHSGRYED